MTVIALQANPAILATVAHELRGPLSALATASELLERDFDLLDRGQTRQMVSSINRRALWLRGLVENLLCEATAGDGHLRIRPQPVDLRVLVDEVGLLIEPLLRRESQRLRIRARLPSVVIGDERRLSQVVLNLLSNASKYAGVGSVIDVGIAMRAGRLRLTVGDRGPGVAETRVNQLFQAYNRAGRTDGEGLGSGLSVVRSIIEAHHGEVGYTARTGGGSMFWFELEPLHEIEQREPVTAGRGKNGG